MGAASTTDLTDVPGIGAKKAALLESLGHPDLASLRGTNADDLYMQAQFREGKQLDKCVLYAFRCAVAYAQDPHPNPDEYWWWYFCDQGKGKKANTR